jgi:type IV secretory pathway VirB10-like protein
MNFEDRGEVFLKIPSSSKNKKVMFLIVLLIFLSIISIFVFLRVFYAHFIKIKEIQIKEDPALEERKNEGESLIKYQKLIKDHIQIMQQEKEEKEAPSLGKYNVVIDKSSEDKNLLRRWEDNVLWNEQEIDSSSGVQKGSLGKLLETESYSNGTVFIRPDLKFLLIHGTTISCVLLPRIVTNYPSQPRCLINRDVYSADGTLVLISRGSIANGEQKVSLKEGVSQVFITWRDIETSDGLSIHLDSMAGDELGGAGVKAWIDKHYADRFGGALLLSFVDNGFQTLRSYVKRNEDIFFDSMSKNTQDLANLALENSIHIPPTGFVNQATETTILVARDVDFQSVYRLR